MSFYFLPFSYVIKTTPIFNILKDNRFPFFLTDCDILRIDDDWLFSDLDLVWCTLWMKLLILLSQCQSRMGWIQVWYLLCQFVSFLSDSSSCLWLFLFFSWINVLYIIKLLVQRLVFNSIGKFAKNQIMNNFLILLVSSIKQIILIFIIHSTWMNSDKPIEVPSVEEMLKSLQITQPAIKGKDCDHELRRVCFSDRCQLPSLHCEHPSCEASYKKHYKCQTISLSGVTSYIQEHLDMNRQFFHQFYSLENQFIEKIRGLRNSAFQDIQFGKLPEKFQNVIQDIFRQSKGDSLNGKLANHFVKKLMGLSEKCENHDFKDQLVDKLTKLYTNAFNQIKKGRNDILQQYMNKIKDIKDYEKLKMDSLIVDLHHDHFDEMMENLYTNLSMPKSFHLIFRASSHQFSAVKFGQICDYQSPTLLVIHTDSKALGIIGAYNINNWTQQEYNTKGSFALIKHFKNKVNLDINAKKNMFPINNNSLVPASFGLFGAAKQQKTLQLQSKGQISQTPLLNSINERFGPTLISDELFTPNKKEQCFGLYISDKCNENSESYFDFPYERTFNSYAYNNQVQFREAVFGKPPKNKFRVLEYEVFKVQF